MNLILTQIDAAQVVGYIPTEAELNSDGDFNYPSSPRIVAPVGDNGFVANGLIEYKILTVDLDGAHATTFDIPDFSGRSAVDENFGLSQLDKDRVIALGRDAPDVWATIASMAGGTPHATGTGKSHWPAGESGRFITLQAPLDPNYDGSVWDPYGSSGSSNTDRWLPGGRVAWANGTQGHAVVWISRSRTGYGGINVQDYEVYLLSFPVDDTEVPELSSTARLLPPAQTPGNPVPDTWLPGEAYPLTDSTFFVADRVHIMERTAQGYRADVTRLRAYDYSANLLAISDPLYTQTENGAGIGTSGSSYCVRSDDGSIVSLVQQDETYGRSDNSTKFLMRRNVFTGSAWNLGPEKLVFDTGHTNERSFVINFQEFQPGRFVIDAMVSDGVAGQYQVGHKNRVLTILDGNFNVTERVVVPPPAAVKYPYSHPEPNWYYSTDHYWSSFAPGSFGLLGWTEYGETAEQWNDIPKAMMVQHSPFTPPIPIIDPNLAAELKDLGQRFSSVPW